MGQLVKVVNFNKLEGCKAGVVYPDNKITCTDGTTQDLENTTNLDKTSLAGAFYVAAGGNTYTAADKNCPFPYASSDAVIPSSQATITNQIGTCSIAFTKTATGWNANITITGSQDATVNSLLFTKKLYVVGNTFKETLLFAYILDSPITLNAENNYTANLTMSVTFE